MRNFRKLLGAAVGLWLLTAATLLPNGEQQFADGNGVPFAAGTVSFFVPNTTTPKTTWKDAAQTTPNANPVVLDAAGRAIIYGNGTYRQVLKDQFGTTIWDQLTSGAGSVIVNSQINGSATVTSCNGVFPILNTAGIAITIALPTSPADGDSCQFADVGNNAGTFAITLALGPKALASGKNFYVMHVNGGQEVGLTWSASTNVWAVN